MSIVGICEQAAKTFARMANSASRVLQPVEFEEHLSKLIEMLSVTMEPSDLGLHRSKVRNIKVRNMNFSWFYTTVSSGYRVNTGKPGRHRSFTAQLWTNRPMEAK